jgi:hypothetical protein
VAVVVVEITQAHQTVAQAVQVLSSSKQTNKSG